MNQNNLDKGKLGTNKLGRHLPSLRPGAGPTQVGWMEGFRHGVDLAAETVSPDIRDPLFRYAHDLGENPAWCVVKEELDTFLWRPFLGD